MIDKLSSEWFDSLKTVENYFIKNIDIESKSRYLISKLGLPSISNPVMNFDIGNKLVKINSTHYLEVANDDGRNYGLMIAVDIKSGEVVQVDINARSVLRFVNTDISALILLAFYWNEMLDTSIHKGLNETVSIFKSNFLEIDKRAFLDEESYWKLMLEDLETNY